jgi:hypothetical protein
MFKKCDLKKVVHYFFMLENVKQDLESLKQLDVKIVFLLEICMQNLFE